MSRIRWYGPTLVLLITVLVVMILGPGVARQIAYTQTQARVSAVKNSLSENPFLAELSESFRKVSKAVEPSVVAIQVLARADNAQRDALRRHLGPDMDGLLDQLEDRQGRDDRYDRYAPPQPIGSGSGWVYRHFGGDDGEEGRDYIITNNHVVRNADVIKIRFHDGAEYEARVVSTDPRTDIAVLEVDAANLVPASIAQDDVQQGDIVFAFGSPLSFDFSMSQGIISATGRELGIINVEGGGYENFIQTDAMINPGNSGGPLTNIYGEVVGMNTAIAAGRGPRTPGNGTFVGLGFAIPAQMVSDIVDQIIENGSVRRGFLGITLSQEDLDERMARSFGFDGRGVLVSEVTAGGPADRAGIQRGDIIIRVDDTSTATIARLRNTVAGYRPGAEVRVELFRNGQTLTVTVVLDEFPTKMPARAADPDQQSDPADDAEGMSALRKLGITGIQDFTEQTAGQLGVGHIPAVMVTAVRTHSVAWAEGMRRGMLITDVMGEPAASVDQLIERVQQHDPNAGIRFSVSTWDRRTRSFIPFFKVLQLPDNGFDTP